MSFVYRNMINKWIRPPKDVQESFVGRTVIVTGATSGLGVEAAAKFAALGASKVIITARDLDKGERVKADIESRIGKKGQLEVWELTMDSYESIVAFAERANTLDHLDIAILNAGLRKSDFEKSKIGWETDLQVNTISTVLLAILLLPKLKASKRPGGKIPVLEFVNSGMSQTATIDRRALAGDSILQAYNTPELFTPDSQYPISKLFLMYAANKLAEQTPSNEVIITSVCPGLVRTDLVRDINFPGFNFILSIISFFMMRTAEQGARVLVSGTVQGEGAHARLWTKDRIQPLGRSIAGEENKRIGLQVWGEIVETLSRDVPAVKGVSTG